MRTTINLWGKLKMSLEAKPLDGRIDASKHLVYVTCITIISKSGKKLSRNKFAEDFDGSKGISKEQFLVESFEVEVKKVCEHNGIPENLLRDLYFEFDILCVAIFGCSLRELPEGGTFKGVAQIYNKYFGTNLPLGLQFADGKCFDLYTGNEVDAFSGAIISEPAPTAIR